MSRILVVDDVEALAGQYAYDLRRIAGHEVATVTTGPAALEHLQREETDCVILDLELAGSDGFDVLRALRHRGDEIGLQACGGGVVALEGAIKLLLLGARGLGVDASGK